MFCPICGQEVEDENDKFCKNCGGKLVTIPSGSQSASTAKSQPMPEYSSYYLMEKKAVKTEVSGPYSKRCLGFAIASLAIAVSAFSFGSELILYILSISNTYDELGYLGTIMKQSDWLIVITHHIVGLALAAISRINRGQAERSPMETSSIKTGSILGLVGILLHATALIIATLFFPIIFS
jgi:hypothetical protein